MNSSSSNKKRRLSSSDVKAELGLEKANVISKDPHRSNLKSLNGGDIDEILSNLDSLNNIQEIDLLQKKLHQDYKSLSKEFSQTRIKRVDTFLNKIEELQLHLKKQLHLYQNFIQQNLPLLDEQTGVSIESLQSQILQKQKIIDCEVNLHKDSSSSSSPPPNAPKSPNLQPLPIFTESFETLLKPYRDSLTTVRNRYDYEADLIESLCKKNVELTWRQSWKEIIETRNNLRLQNNQKLIDLQNDYQNVHKNLKLSKISKQYRRNIRKVGEKISKVELTQIDKIVKDRKARFNTQNLLIDPNNISSASTNEIDHDLTLMKKPNSKLKIERYEANYLYMEQPLHKASNIGPPTMTDLVNDQMEGGYGNNGPTTMTDYVNSQIQGRGHRLSYGTMTPLERKLSNAARPTMTDYVNNQIEGGFQLDISSIPYVSKAPPKKHYYVKKADRAKMSPSDNVFDYRLHQQRKSETQGETFNDTQYQNSTERQNQEHQPSQSSPDPLHPEQHLYQSQHQPLLPLQQQHPLPLPSQPLQRLQLPQQHSQSQQVLYPQFQQHYPPNTIFPLQQSTNQSQSWNLNSEFSTTSSKPNLGIPNLLNFGFNSNNNNNEQNNNSTSNNFNYHPKPQLPPQGSFKG